MKNTFEEYYDKEQEIELKELYFDFKKLHNQMTKTSDKAFFISLHHEIDKVDKGYNALVQKTILEAKHLYIILHEIYEEDLLHSLKEMIVHYEEEMFEESQVIKTSKSWLNEESKNCNKRLNEVKLSDKGRWARMIPIFRIFSVSKRKKVVFLVMEDLLLIENFQRQNLEAINTLISLFKKSRDENQQKKADEFVQGSLKDSLIYKDKTVSNLLSEFQAICKSVFNLSGITELFENIQSKENPISYFEILIGALGCASILLACSFAMFIKEDSKRLSVFLSYNLFFIMHFSFITCLDIFNRYGINSTLIFKFDRTSKLINRKNLLANVLFHMCYLVSKITCFFLNSKLKKDENSGLTIFIHFLTNYFEIFFILATLIIFCIPFDVLYFTSRNYIPSVYLRALCIPHTKVTFRHFFFLDIAQSLKFSIKNILGLLIDSDASSSLKILPDVICFIFPCNRIIQCIKRFSDSRAAFPHIANASKYITSILTDIIAIQYSKSLTKVDKSSNSTFFLLLLFTLLNFIFSLSWDIFIDFKIERAKKLFHPYTYIAIVIYDTFTRAIPLCRLLFLQKLLMNFSPCSKVFIDVFMAIAEIIRRSFWTLLRVEVEHLNNLDLLRVDTKVRNTNTDEYFYENNDIDKNIEDISESYLKSSFVFDPNLA